MSKPDEQRLIADLEKISSEGKARVREIFDEASKDLKLAFDNVSQDQLMKAEVLRSVSDWPTNPKTNDAIRSAMTAKARRTGGSEGSSNNAILWLVFAAGALLASAVGVVQAGLLK